MQFAIGFGVGAFVASTVIFTWAMCAAAAKGDFDR